jgi:hypothetical protein
MRETTAVGRREAGVQDRALRHGKTPPAIAAVVAIESPVAANRLRKRIDFFIKESPVVVLPTEYLRGKPILIHGLSQLGETTQGPPPFCIGETTQDSLFVEERLQGLR